MLIVEIVIKREDGSVLTRRTGDALQPLDFRIGSQEGIFDANNSVDRFFGFLYQPLVNKQE